MDILQRNVRNGNSVGRGASGPAIEIVLLDVNSISRNVGERNVLISDARDEPGGLRDTFDANTIFRIDNLRVPD